MSVTTYAKHQMTLDRRVVGVVVVAALAALVLSIVLPLALQSTRTVVVRSTQVGAGVQVTHLHGVALMRASHGR